MKGGEESGVPLAEGVGARDVCGGEPEEVSEPTEGRVEGTLRDQDVLVLCRVREGRNKDKIRGSHTILELVGV